MLLIRRGFIKVMMFCGLIVAPTASAASSDVATLQNYMKDLDNCSVEWPTAFEGLVKTMSRLSNKTGTKALEDASKNISVLRQITQDGIKDGESYDSALYKATKVRLNLSLARSATSRAYAAALESKDAPSDFLEEIFNLGVTMDHAMAIPMLVQTEGDF